ncbi:GerMN domain-containing protein [Alteribacter natronophilus]|uniref:GerMN domain-containing protein n=1 Tax=Alteribacter natronophilus TaxID=2583810 RepID=UPI00110E188C|nr:GerMN domain-containing protein [Alteribacter natronophilus]TMW70160.1 GerMN domain-containing protein [Alteribacter natronophilus]
MKKAKWLFVTLSTALVLSACGQGDNGEDTPASADEDVTEEQTEGDENTEQDDEELGDEELDDEENDEDEEVSDDEEAEEDGQEEETEESLEEEDSSEGEGSDSSEGEEAAVLEGVDYYFSDDQLMETYRVSTDETVTHNEEGAKQVLEGWINGPEHSGLTGLFHGADVTVQSVTFEGDTAFVSFSSEVFELNLGSSGELMFYEQLAMHMSQFGYDKTQLQVDGEVPEEFLGHLDVSEPFTAGDAADYDVFN